MNEAEKKPSSHRLTLIEGDRIPQTHPEALVEWPAGRPPGRPARQPSRRKTTNQARQVSQTPRPGLAGPFFLLQRNRSSAMTETFIPLPINSRDCSDYAIPLTLEYQQEAGWWLSQCRETGTATFAQPRNKRRKNWNPTSGSSSANWKTSAACPHTWPNGASPRSRRRPTVPRPGRHGRIQSRNLHRSPETAG